MSGLNFGRTTTESNFDGPLVYRQMKGAFEEALESPRAALSESSFAFIDQCAHVRINGIALAALIMRPFQHLRRTASWVDPCGLTIDLWHEAETGRSCPVNLVDTQNKQLWSSWEGEYGITMGSPNNRYVACQRFSTFTCLDRKARHLVGWVGDHAQLSLYEMGKPLHLPLLLWHHDQDAHVIHAGLVSKNRRGALFLGKGDTGKSTCALACLRSDFLYVGDDYIGIKNCDDGRYVGYGLYNSTWLRDDNLSRFPELASHVIRATRPDRQKHLVLLAEIFSAQIVSSAPIHVIILPRLIGHGPSRILPATKGEALLASAPSSIILLPSSGASGLNNLAALVSQLPCYWLEVGNDLSTIPEQIDKVLERVG